MIPHQVKSTIDCQSEQVISEPHFNVCNSDLCALPEGISICFPQSGGYSHGVFMTSGLLVPSKCPLPHAMPSKPVYLVSPPESCQHLKGSSNLDREARNCPQSLLHRHSPSKWQEESRFSLSRRLAVPGGKAQCRCPDEISRLTIDTAKFIRIHEPTGPFFEPMHDSFPRHILTAKDAVCGDTSNQLTEKCVEVEEQSSVPRRPQVGHQSTCRWEAEHCKAFE